MEFLDVWYRSESNASSKELAFGIGSICTEPDDAQYSFSSLLLSYVHLTNSRVESPDRKGIGPSSFLTREGGLDILGEVVRCTIHVRWSQLNWKVAHLVICI
jgi:hypothetical protein